MNAGVVFELIVKLALGVGLYWYSVTMLCLLLAVLTSDIQEANLKYRQL